MVEVNDVTGLCNTVYSFFLRQIYWHIPVKMELWNSIVEFFDLSEVTTLVLDFLHFFHRLCV